jgi:hypothetical protein
MLIRIFIDNNMLLKHLLNKNNDKFLNILMKKGDYYY